MAFENKSIESVNDLIVSGLETELNTKFRLLPKSFVRVLAKVLSAVFISLYRQQAWIFLQMFVETSSFDEIEVLGKRIRPLVLWGDLVGIGTPGTATQFEGKIKIKSTKLNTYIMQGTQFVNPATNIIYLAVDSVLLRDSEMIIKVRSAESGTVANLNIGDELKTTSPLVNIERSAVCTEVTTEAVDDEDEATYRNRVISRWRVQPQGGALNDYRKWSSEVPGVLQTYIYKDDNSASGVLIYVVANNESRIPASDLLVKVGEYCSFDPVTGEGRKPITATLDPDNDGSYKNIRPCSILEFDVYVNGYSGSELSSFCQSVKSNLTVYLKQREPFVRGLSVDDNRVDRISEVNISGIVNDIAEGLNGFFDGVELKKNDERIENYKLGRGELAKLRKVFVNGVEI